jgi:hypothetical protein
MSDERMRKLRSLAAEGSGATAGERAAAKAKIAELAACHVTGKSFAERIEEISRKRRAIHDEITALHEEDRRLSKELSKILSEMRKKKEEER